MCQQLRALACGGQRSSVTLHRYLVIILMAYDSFKSTFIYCVRCLVGVGMPHIVCVEDAGQFVGVGSLLSLGGAQR